MLKVPMKELWSLSQIKLPFAVIPFTSHLPKKAFRQHYFNVAEMLELLNYRLQGRLTSNRRSK